MHILFSCSALQGSKALAEDDANKWCLVGRERGLEFRPKTNTSREASHFVKCSEVNPIGRRHCNVKISGLAFSERLKQIHGLQDCHTDEVI